MLAQTLAGLVLGISNNNQLEKHNQDKQVATILVFEVVILYHQSLEDTFDHYGMILSLI